MKKIFHLRKFLFIILGLLFLCIVWIAFNRLFSSKFPEYLYMIHSPKGSGRKLYRFEQGAEEPTILSLKGVQGEPWDFCVINEKLYVLCRQDSGWCLAECDTDGTFLRSIDSEKLQDLKKELLSIWTDGSRLFLLHNSKESIMKQEEWVEGFPRTEDGRIYDATREYLCLNEKTGRFEATSLYTSFSTDIYPMGIGQEKGFSYASSSLWRETKEGKSQGIAFFCKDLEQEQDWVLPIDEALLEKYGYPGRKGVYRSYYQDGTTLYANFWSEKKELELFTVTVKNGEIEECRRLDEVAGCEIRFAKDGRLLLAGADGFYEYEEGKGITPFAIEHWKSFYNGSLYWSECGYILASNEIEEENGIGIPLSEGEGVCFLRWYGEETAKEYWLQ